MDQLVVDLGDDDGSRPATRSCCSAPARDGAPTAQDWAEACGTISYEIVTRIGGRFVRRHVSSKGLMDAMSRASVARARRRGHGRGRGRGDRRRRRRAPGRPVAPRPASHRRRRARRPAQRGAHRPAPTTASACTPRSTRSRRTPRRPRRPGRPRGSAAAPAGRARRDDRVRARLRAEPGLLALPARVLPRQAPHGVLRPALARPVRPLRQGSTPPSTSSATTCGGCSTSWCPTGRSCWSATRWAACRSWRSPSGTPSCSTSGSTGVALMSTTAGGLKTAPHRQPADPRLDRRADRLRG